MAISPTKKPLRFPAILERFQAAFLLWENPIGAAIFAGLVFLVIASLFAPPWRVSSAPYYNYLADAFLHGQLGLRVVPPSVYDLSPFHGQYFLTWGLLPGVLAMPWVLIFGLGASDVLQTICVAAANAGIFALLLRAVDRRGWVPLSPGRRALLALFFALGTAQTALPAVGTVWYLVQLESLTAALLAGLAVFALDNKKAFFWTGVAVAAVILTRPSAVFVAVFLAWYLLRRHWPLGWRKLGLYCLYGLLPVLAALALTLAYNALRFGSPLETGASYHLMGPQYVEIFKRYGYMSLHYVPVNLNLTYVFYPFFRAHRQISFTALGGNIFLLSPLFLGMLYALWQDRADKDTWALFLAFLLGNIPVMMIMGPGAVQFGPRYALDFALPMLLLTMRGVRRWPLSWIALLTAASVLQYLVGAILVEQLFLQ